MPVVIAEIPLRTLLIISVKGFGWRSMYGRKKETPSPDSKNEDVENIVQIVLDLDAGWCDVFFADGDCFRVEADDGKDLLKQWNAVRRCNARSSVPLERQPMSDPGEAIIDMDAFPCGLDCADIPLPEPRVIIDGDWCDVFFADGDCFRFASSVGEELLEQWGTVRHYNARSNTPLKQQPMNDPQRQVDFELP